jgi:hypothetical protein
MSSGRPYRAHCGGDAPGLGGTPQVVAERINVVRIMAAGSLFDRRQLDAHGAQIGPHVCHLRQAEVAFAVGIDHAVFQRCRPRHGGQDVDPAHRSEQALVEVGIALQFRCDAVIGGVHRGNPAQVSTSARHPGT